MSLRAQMLICLVVLMLALGVSLGALYEWRAGDVFRTMEEKINDRDLRIVQNLVNAERSILASDLDGYAVWDEAYDMAADPQPENFKEWLQILTPETLVNEHYDFFLWRANDGRELHRLAVDRDSGEAIPFPAAVDVRLEPGRPLWPQIPSRTTITGFITLDGRTAVVSSNPVHPATSTGDVPNSRMVAGRWLDTLLSHVSDLSDMPVALDDGTALAPGWYALDLAGVDGAPAATLRVHPPSMSGLTITQVRNLFFLGLGLAFLVFGAFFYIALEQVVLKPLADLQIGLHRIVATRDYGQRVAVPSGNVAFQHHAAAINQVLDGFEEARAEVARRMEVEKALSEVALLLRRQKGEKVIARSLQTLGRHLDVDVLSYYQLLADGRSMHCIGTFRLDGELFSGAYDFTAPAAQWVVNASSDRNPISFADVSQIPDRQADIRSFVQEYDLRSFLAVPLPATDDGLRGVVAFGHIRNAHEWSDEDVRILGVVAELFAYAGTRLETTS